MGRFPGSFELLAEELADWRRAVMLGSSLPSWQRRAREPLVGMWIGEADWGLGEL